MLHFTQQVLWVAGPLIQVAIAVIFVRRGYVHQLPWFFGYTVFHIAQFLVLFGSHRVSYATYFYAYWATDSIDALLTLIVLQELFTDAFGGYEAIRALAMRVFRWGMLLLVLVAFVSAIVASGTEADRLITGLLVMARSVNLVQCGILALLLTIYRSAGFRLSSLPVSIGVGFGVIAGVSTVIMGLRAYESSAYDSYFSMALAAAYDAGVLIWIAAICAPARRRVTGELPSAAVLERWNLALMKAMNP